MLKRCSATVGYEYEKYAARGIKVCDEWLVFETFRAWALKTGYADTLTIDRKDNDGHYEPKNCKWSTQQTQARNRRSSKWITINGETKTLAEWAEISPVTYFAIQGRLNMGWSAENAIFTPLRSKKA